MEKHVLGLYEDVLLRFKENIIRMEAKIDTGATRSSVDISLIRSLKADTFVGETEVRSANGITKRKIIKLKITIAGKESDAYLSVADRSKMKTKVLIGQDILKNGFIVDPDR